MAARQHLAGGLAALPLVVALGCAGFPALGRDGPRVSDHLAQGDARLRASQRLVLEGLDADAAGDAARARGRYERALQVDASNPWAYLALARHHVEAGQPVRALAHLDQAEVLFESDGSGSPGALVHCDGLRGAALALQGRRGESRTLLDAAARHAPRAWGDAHLSAAELR